MKFLLTLLLATLFLITDQASCSKDFTACYWETDNSKADLYELHRLDTPPALFAEEKLAVLEVRLHSVKLNLYGMSIGELSPEKANQIFGTPKFRGTSKRAHSLSLISYQLKGYGPPLNELNTFDIELEYNDKNEIQTYKVTGKGIRDTGLQIVRS